MECMSMYTKKTMIFALSLLISITTCIAMRDSVLSCNITQDYSSYNQASNSNNMGSTTVMSSIAINEDRFTSIRVIHQPDAPAQVELTSGTAYDDVGMMLRSTHQITVPITVAAAMRPQGGTALAQVHSNSTTINRIPPPDTTTQNPIEYANPIQVSLLRYQNLTLKQKNYLPRELKMGKRV